MYNDVKTNAQIWHLVDGEDSEVAVCSRLINLTTQPKVWRE